MYSIRNTDQKSVKARNGNSTYIRCTRLYQCLCGTDSEASKREIGWRHVGCTGWIKLVTTHDEHDAKSEQWHNPFPDNNSANLII